MLPNLQVVLFLIYLIMESFKNLFMRYLAMDSIVVYRTTIIPNTLDKMTNCIEFRVVKGWLT